MRDHFIEYRDDVKSKMEQPNCADINISQFKPPKAKLSEAIFDMIELFNEGLFIKKETIIKAAKATGIIPADNKGNFDKFQFPPMRATGTLKSGTSIVVPYERVNNPDFQEVNMNFDTDKCHSDSTLLEPELFLGYMLREPAEVDEEEDFIQYSIAQRAIDDEESRVSEQHNDVFFTLGDFPIRNNAGVRAVVIGTDDNTVFSLGRQYISSIDSRQSDYSPEINKYLQSPDASHRLAYLDLPSELPSYGINFNDEICIDIDEALEQMDN